MARRSLVQPEGARHYTIHNDPAQLSLLDLTPAELQREERARAAARAARRAARAALPGGAPDPAPAPATPARRGRRGGKAPLPYKREGR